MRVMRMVETNDSNGFMMGDRIEVDLDGFGSFTATCQEVKDGSALFFMDDCVTDKPMNRKDTNRGGFEASDLCAWIQERLAPAFKEFFGDRLQYVTIPTREQIFGRDEYADKYESLGGDQLPLQKIRQNRVCSDPEGEWDWYWLQNRRLSSASTFAHVGSHGHSGSGTASNSAGVRPAFALTDR